MALPGNGMIPPGPSMETNAQFTGPVFTAPKPTPVASFQQPSVRAKVTNYTLDRPKQLKKLRKDTSLSDFTIEVSKNKQNVNINCNTGFYTKVAVPALQNLSAGQIAEFNGIIVQCQDIVGNFDATQAQQNTVIYFRLSQDKLSLGGVRIHLHNTTRRIKVQGGALLPDEKTTR